MNERLKIIRQYFDMSQEDFGEKLGVQNSTISKIESGSHNLTERMLKSVCREFDINEDWLRTGKGEMFLQLPKKERVTEIVAKSLMTDNELMLNAVIALGNLSENEWELVRKFAEQLLDGVKQKDKLKKE